MYFVLDNIRSAWNVGAIFRTADALGAKIILIGYTPKPVGNTLKLVKKTAIGAENTVSWQHFDHWRDVLQNFPNSQKNRHFAVEISKKSQDIFNFLSHFQTNLQKDSEIFLWFGNELAGVNREAINELEAEIHLPMLGLKESLNVASTVCTVGYLFYGQINKK